MASKPEAETPIQPLTWCFQSLSFDLSSSPEECFFTDTGSSDHPSLRPIFIQTIFRPRIFESTFRDHCAKKLDGALRNPTSFV